MLDTARAEFFIEMDDNFSITRCSEAMPPGFQLLSKVLVVVDLTIQYDPDCFVFIGNRLISCLQVNDAESPHSKTHWTTHVVTVVIRPSVRHAVAHRAYHIWGDRMRHVRVNDACDSTHCENLGYRLSEWINYPAAALDALSLKQSGGEHPPYPASGFPSLMSRIGTLSITG